MDKQADDRKVLMHAVDQQGRAEEEGTMTCTSEELSNLQHSRESKEISRDDAHHQVLDVQLVDTPLTPEIRSTSSSARSTSST